MLLRLKMATGAYAVASRCHSQRISFFDATCSLVQRRSEDNIVEILKFSRETVFTPETIQILGASLDKIRSVYAVRKWLVLGEIISMPGP